MDNNKKLNDFTTYSNSYNAAMVTNDVPKMQAAIDDILNLLPGSDIPSLSMDNLQTFADRINAIINSVKGFGIDTEKLEITRDYLRLAYHQRKEVYDGIAEDISKADNLEKSIDKNIKDKIKAAKLALYLSGDETLGRTTYKLNDASEPEVSVHLTQKDIDYFDKTAAYKSIRTRNIVNKGSESAISYSAEVTDNIEDVFADLKEIAVSREAKKKRQEELAAVKEGRTPLDGVDFNNVNRRTVTPPTNEFDEITRLYDNNVEEFKRVTSKINTYEDIMRLSQDELEKLSVVMDNYNKSFERDFKKINAYIKKHPDDIKSMNMLTSLLYTKKSVRITLDAIDDVEDIRDELQDNVNEEMITILSDLREYENNFLFAAKRDELKFRYILGQASDKEVESFNNTVPKEFRVKLTAKEKKDKQIIEEGNEILEGVYKRNLATAQKKLNKCKLEYNALQARYDKMKVIRDSLNNGKLNKYTEHIVKEKGSIPVGYNLMKNMESDKGEVYQDMLKAIVAVPDDTVDYYEIVEDSTRDTGAPKGGSGGTGSTEPLETATEAKEEEATEAKDRTDAPGDTGGSDGSGETGGEGDTEAKEEEATEGKTKSKPPRRRINPKVLGQLHNAARVLGIVAAVTTAVGVVTFAWNAGVGLGLIQQSELAKTVLQGLVGTAAVTSMGIGKKK